MEQKGSEGHKASAIVKKHFPPVLKELQSEILTTPVEALTKAFKQVNEMLIEDPSVDSYMSGTTAVIALLVQTRLIVAHTGDSRLIVVESVDGGVKGVQVTVDHTCQVATEYARVESKGARIEQYLVENKSEGFLN